ncbi:alpha/beta fold hydrolase [Vulgatibacter incomptus]|uniref:Beta-ketoadipate enol-lactone hydrolase n=1 Tax=Vulgatibacter incomptus TaxID=1391653 RepID=A0A0K1PFX6_9BACT|nr:alpha/beta fold hydrolase [Vulgatibacter incomptus]AKU92420.1 Beta-ketoadipate enol-lactone hydrolase [Vulgatibacter incomptus]
MAHAHVNGIWVHFHEHGEGEPVLLVMGLGAPLEGWDPQLPALSNRYRVIRFDNRGVGGSDKPVGRYTVGQLAEDARGLLDHLGVDKAHVVGLSMGGMAAMELAARHPGRVRSLVLASTTPAADARMRWTMGRIAARIGAAAVRASGSLQERAAAVQEELVRIWLPLVFSASPGGTEEATLRRLMGQAFSGGFPAAGAAGQLAACFSHDARSRLSQLVARTLVIGGTNDAIFEAKRFDELVRAIPGATLELFDGAPHGINLARPDDFNERVLRFLESR